MRIVALVAVILFSGALMAVSSLGSDNTLSADELDSLVASSRSVQVDSVQVVVTRIDEGYKHRFGPYTKTSVWEWRYDAPDRLSLKERSFEYEIDSDRDGELDILDWSNGCGASEIVVVGTEVLSRCGTGDWHSQQRSATTSLSLADGEDLLRGIRELRDLVELTEESLDGQQMRVLAGEMPALNSKLASVRKLWIDKETHILRRSVEEHVWNNHTEDRPHRITITKDYSAVNSVTIVKPAGS